MSCNEISWSRKHTGEDYSRLKKKEKKKESKKKRVTYHQNEKQWIEAEEGRSSSS